MLDTLNADPPDLVAHGAAPQGRRAGVGLSAGIGLSSKPFTKNHSLARGAVYITRAAVRLGGPKTGGGAPPRFRYYRVHPLAGNVDPEPAAYSGSPTY